MTTETETGRRSTPRRTASGPARPGPRSGDLGTDVSRVPRRYGQWTGAVLFVVLAALAAGWLWQQRGDRVEILTVNRDVPAGTVIEQGDLSIADVAGLGQGIPASRADSVVGELAAVPLVGGQVLMARMLTNEPLPGPGRRMVGVQLDATRSPADLAPGDVVSVLAVPPMGNAGSPSSLEEPSVLADRATVVSARQVAGEGIQLTMLVPKDVANTVAAFGAAGRVAVVQAPIGGD